ncbi:hypothetical protein A9993_07700 [Rahnella victoriana]|uniref:hypothetical protein n=1 Tax=Rahnella victoriana TaxID=1510570 RepID=UPI000BB1F391|nr:hypothetical protein [Rahnella victoriana]PBI79628.1 hypothetical protein A9993_07700 [Rahnella victoriana]
MNNDLERFSEERLKDMQEHVTAGMTLGHADALLIRQVIDIALAAKQAKPVGRIEGWNDHEDIYIIQWFGNQQDLPKGAALYTTPQPAHTEQDGWKLVPIEPTEKMIARGADMCGIKTIYKAMLAAAPKPESE